MVANIVKFEMDKLIFFTLYYIKIKIDDNILLFVDTKSEVKLKPYCFQFKQK